MIFEAPLEARILVFTEMSVKCEVRHLDASMPRRKLSHKGEC